MCIIQWFKKINDMICFEHQKSLTQYPFSILYLPTQLQMYIVYRKTGFKSDFQDF